MGCIFGFWILVKFRGIYFDENLKFVSVFGMVVLLIFFIIILVGFGVGFGFFFCGLIFLSC